MSLASKIKGIEDAIVAILTGASISGINGIVFESELRYGKILPPYIRIFCEASRVNPNFVGIQEEWFMRIRVMVVASAYGSADADAARDLALQASSALMDNRQLNNTVADMVRLQWDPNYRHEIATVQLTGAAILLEARFLSKET